MDEEEAFALVRVVDEDHALLVGSLIGLVLRAESEGYPYVPEIIDDKDGIHLAVFAINAPSGRYLVHVLKAT
jgi:hypothetical protein